MEENNNDLNESMDMSTKEAEIIKTYEIGGEIETLEYEENEVSNNATNEIAEDKKEKVEEKESEDTTNQETLSTDKKEDKIEGNLEEDKKEKKERKKKEKKKGNIFTKIFNILFTLIIMIMILIVVDVVCFTQFNIGPFLVIPLNKHKDGGTTEYYGLGYKVIKYKQTQGRRDKEIGTWSLEYNVEPITFQDIDLAIELNGNEEYTYQKYNKKFVRIISTLKKVNLDKHQIIVGYDDDGGKYSLDFVCDMVKEQKNLKKLKVGEEITLIGTFDSFKLKTSKANNKIHMVNCFAEQ